MKPRISLILSYIVLLGNPYENLAWKSPSVLTSSSFIKSISYNCHNYEKILSLRGGSDDEDSSDYDDSELDENDNRVTPILSLNQEKEELNTTQNEDDEDGNDSNDEGEIISTSSSNTSSTSAVKITLKTAVTNNPLIDQSIEITASPTRTIQSLKQSVSRQFKARPPMESIQLRFDGKLLNDDDALVEDLIVEEEDEEEDHGDEEEDHDGMHKLTILVDMIPPVDPKFGTEMKARLDDTTNEQLLEAYVVNLAAMHQNSMEVMKQQMGDMMENEEVQEKEEDEDVDTSTNEVKEHSSVVFTAPINLTLQKYANQMKMQVINSLSEDEKKLLEKRDTSSSRDQIDSGSYSSGDVLLKESMKRKRRGGASMNMKRVIQKNLNINWPDTIRNFLLFLFFGYFGGRNAMSRTIMLLGAPACFIIQARPVKIALKQIFYTIGEPPGILLSLLPAPQQTIMSCDYNSSLKSIYGDDILRCNEVVAEGIEDDSNHSESTYGDSDEEEYDSDY